MENQKLFADCYTDVLYTLADLTQGLYDAPTDEEIEYFIFIAI